MLNVISLERDAHFVKVLVLLMSVPKEESVKENECENVTYAVEPENAYGAMAKKRQSGKW